MASSVVVFGSTSIIAFILGGICRFTGGKGYYVLLSSILVLCVLAGWSLRFGWPPRLSEKIGEAVPWMILAALIVGSIIDRLDAPAWVENVTIPLLAIGSGCIVWFMHPTVGTLWEHILLTVSVGMAGLIVLWRLQSMSARPAASMISLFAATVGLYGIALMMNRGTVADPALFMGAGLAGILPWVVRDTGRLPPVLFLSIGCAWLTLAGNMMKNGGILPVLLLLAIFFAETAFMKKDRMPPTPTNNAAFLSLCTLTAACILSIFVALLVAYVGSGVAAKP